METVRAFYAHFNHVPGIALCDPQQHVFFAADATGLWQELSNADAPALLLLGRVDLVLTQKIRDERFGSLLALIDYKNTERPRRVA